MPKSKIEVKKEDRVGCFLDTRTFIGWGYHLGMQPIPKGIGTNFGMPIGSLNPKIVLDSGKVVWGSEMWWGEEKKIQAKINYLGDKMETITVEELREKFYGSLPEKDRPELEMIEFTVIG